MDPVVYIVQEPPLIRDRATGRQIPKDLSSAQRYGRIEPILKPTDQASLTPGPCFQTLRRALHDFKPHDYVCFAGGDPMSLALALLTLRDMGFKEVQVLRWDRERDTQGVRQGVGFYVPITTPLYP